MHHFFVTPDSVGEKSIVIQGDDVNHIKNVLRMKPGEEVIISDGQGCDYICEISEILDSEVVADITDMQKEGTELPVKLYLFQALPKSDKMELIIQKAVELGAYAVVPVKTSRCVVKLDKKKEESKLKRWNTIALSAAKQSKRSIIPKVMPVLSLSEAFEMVRDFEYNVIPYENFKDMSETSKVMDNIPKSGSIGIFIGPEGGFATEEVDKAIEAGVHPISLGKRILRTETAGMTILSVLMFRLEE